MDGYWWGVLTPFAIILGILLLYLTGNLFGAIVSWAWKKAHYGLLCVLASWRPLCERCFSAV